MVKNIKNAKTYGAIEKDGGATFAAGAAMSAFLFKVLGSKDKKDIQQLKDDIGAIRKQMKVMESKYNQHLDNLVLRDLKASVYSLADALKFWAENETRDELLTPALQPAIEASRLLYSIVQNRPSYLRDESLLVLEDLNLLNYAHLQTIVTAIDARESFLRDFSPRIIDGFRLFLKEGLDSQKGIDQRRCAQCHGIAEYERDAVPPYKSQEWGYSVDGGFCTLVTTAEATDTAYWDRYVADAREDVDRAISGWALRTANSSRNKLNGNILNLITKIEEVAGLPKSVSSEW